MNTKEHLYVCQKERSWLVTDQKEEIKYHIGDRFDIDMEAWNELLKAIRDLKGH
jgi:hypothetical protein